jgi:hypothetical protein
MEEMEILRYLGYVLATTFPLGNRGRNNGTLYDHTKAHGIKRLCGHQVIAPSAIICSALISPTCLRNNDSLFSSQICSKYFMAS